MTLHAQEDIEHPNRIAWAILWRVWLFWTLASLPGLIFYFWLVVSVAMGCVAGGCQPQYYSTLFAVGRFFIYLATIYIATMFALTSLHGKKTNSSLLFLGDFEGEELRLSKYPRNLSGLTLSIFVRYAVPIAALECVLTIAYFMSHGDDIYGALGKYSQQYMGLYPGSSYIFLVVLSTIFTFAAHFFALRWVVRTQHQVNVGGSTFMVATVQNNEAPADAH